MIEIAFRAFNPHELLVHEIAQRSGAYDDANVVVRVVDGIGRPVDDLIHTFGLGDVLITSSQRSAWSIPLVYTDRPLFWLYAREPLPMLRVRDGVRLAMHPAGTAPYELANLALQRLGFTDTQLRTTHQTSDARRLEAVTELGLDGGVFGTAIPPNQLAAAGLQQVVCVGDIVRLPTTGLASSQPGAELDSVREAQRRAWTEVEAPLAAEALRALVPGLGVNEAVDLYLTEYRPRLHLTALQVDLAPFHAAKDVIAAVQLYERSVPDA